MNKKSVYLLNKEDLKAAAHLCLMKAALTDLDQIPSDLNQFRKDHNERRDRFNQALEQMASGTTSLTELGISPEDCAWAAKMSHYVQNEKEWEARFLAAEEELQRMH